MSIDQPSQFICEICSGSHPTDTHPKKPETQERREGPMEVQERRQFEYKKKMRGLFKLTPESTNPAHEIKLQELAEHDARLIAIARVESNYMGRKVGDIYRETFYRKRQELLEPLGLHIYKGMNEYEAYDVLQYNGKKVDGVYQFLSNPKLLSEELQAEDEMASMKEYRRKRAEQFQTNFGALPEDIQNAARDWVRWDTDIDGVGKTLDVMLEAGRVKRDAYDEIHKAHAEGKEIIHNVIHPDTGIIKQGTYRRRYYYWAIVDRPETQDESINAAHQTTEQKEKAKKYRVVEEIRFEEGVPEETVRDFLQFLKQEEDRFTKEHYKKNADGDCLAEKIMSPGLWRGTTKGKDITFPIVHNPLVPYSLLSAYHTVDEVDSNRRKFAKYTIDKPTGISRMELDAPPGDLVTFENFENANSQDVPPESIHYFFEPMKFNPNTKTSEFPFLTAVEFGRHPNRVKKDLPPGLIHKIKVKEIFVKYLSDKFNVTVVIDENGWRIDALE